MGIKIAVAQFSNIATTGNQDITTTDLGGLTPKAAIFLSSDTATLGTVVSVAILNVGLTDGTSHVDSTITLRHNVATMETAHRSATDQVIQLLGSGAGTAIFAEAEFVSWITDGVRINWNDSTSNIYIHTVIFFAGSDLSVKVGTFEALGPDATETAVVTTFQPDDVFFLSSGNPFDDTMRSGANVQLGVAHRGAGGAITQGCIAHNHISGVADAEAEGIIQNDRIAATLSSGLSREFELSSFQSNGFTVKHYASGSSASQWIGYLALSYGGKANSYVGVETTSTSITTKTTTAPGFQPQFVMLLPTYISALNAIQNTVGEVASYGLSHITSTTEYSLTISDEDASAASDTQSLLDSVALRLPTPAGVASIQATRQSLDATGYTLNYSAVNATARQMITWVISQEITGTTYPQTVSGDVAPTGALAYKRVKYLSGEVTPTGTLLERAKKVLTASLTPTGALRKVIAKRSLAGTVSSSAILAARKVVIKLLSGSLGSSGSLSKMTKKVLDGTVTIAGSLLGLIQKARAKLLPLRGIFSTNTLSFTVQSAPWSSTTLNREITQDVTAYDHSIVSMGGFWSANLSLRLPLSEIEEWMNKGIGSEITVKSRAKKSVFEGIVNRVSLNVGGYNMSVGPYLDISNKIKISYSVFLDLGEGSATGIRQETEYLEDTESQLKYGILTKNFSAGGVSPTYVAELQQMLLNRFRNPPLSEDLSLPGDTGIRFVDIKLECIGYVHLFQRYTYNSETTGLQYLHTKLSSIIQAEPNFIFTEDIQDNELEVPAYEKDDNEAWGLIKGLVTLGDTNFSRYLFGCYDNRVVTYRGITEEIIYYRPLREGSGVLLDRLGGTVQPWEVRPGIYIMVIDLLPGKPVSSDITEDNRVIFAETVQFRLPNNLIINGSHSFKVEQKLAQLGIKGLG